MDFINYIGVFIVFGALLFLAYLTTRYIGSKAGRAMKGKHISVVESVSLGLDKQLHLLKIAEEFVLIASSGKNIEFLTKVNIKDYENMEALQENSPFDFKIIFDNYMQAIKNLGKPEKKDNTGGFDSKAEGEIFRSNLKKLKTINIRADRQENSDGDEFTNEE